jgi:hypothetical protein
MIARTLAQQDEDAAELDEAEIVESLAFVTHNKTAEVPKPSKESLDLPPAPLAAPRSSASICSLWHLPNQRVQDRPLLVSQVHRRRLLLGDTLPLIYEMAWIQRVLECASMKHYEPPSGSVQSKAG